MQRHELADALLALDENLTTSHDLIVIGGAAMILHFGASRATRDIDILLLRGDLAELRKAANIVAEEFGLPSDWLSDAAKGFADILPPDFYRRLIPLESNFRHLRLYALGLPDQTAMKIIALREQDLDDLEVLLPQLSEEERQVVARIAHHVDTFRPDWAQKMRYFLEEQGWEIS